MGSTQSHDPGLQEVTVGAGSGVWGRVDVPAQLWFQRHGSSLLFSWHHLTPPPPPPSAPWWSSSGGSAGGAMSGGVPTRRNVQSSGEAGASPSTPLGSNPRRPPPASTWRGRRRGQNPLNVTSAPFSRASNQRRRPIFFFCVSEIILEGRRPATGCPAIGRSSCPIRSTYSCSWPGSVRGCGFTKSRRSS